MAALDHPENLISALTVEGMWRVGICLMFTWNLSCGTLSNFPIATHSSFTFSLISPELSILVESCWFSLLASQINYFLTSTESYLGPNPSFSEVLLALYVANILQFCNMICHSLWFPILVFEVSLIILIEILGSGDIFSRGQSDSFRKKLSEKWKVSWRAQTSGRIMGWLLEYCDEEAVVLHETFQT